MSDQIKHPACTEKNYIVRRSELPLSCPTDDMTLWNAHPKVYLPIEDSDSGQCTCPYCGSRFILTND
jgi:uncharacterized Zn-finger protein